MVAEADVFIYDLKKSVCHEKLLNDYQWANDFEKLVRSDCHIAPILKHLHYIGYITSFSFDIDTNNNISYFNFE